MEHIDNHDANFADSISFEQDEQPRKELTGDLLRIDEILEATLRQPCKWMVVMWKSSHWKVTFLL